MAASGTLGVCVEVFGTLKYKTAKFVCKFNNLLQNLHKIYRCLEYDYKRNDQQLPYKIGTELLCQ